MTACAYTLLNLISLYLELACILDLTGRELKLFLLFDIVHCFGFGRGGNADNTDIVAFAEHFLH